MENHAPLSVEDLLRRARAEAGCANFGNLSFMPPFVKLVESINGVRELFHDRGRIGMEDRLVRLLVNRLRMQRDIELHPEILAEPLLPPASITGLPRTGSTKLQRLLAAGKGFQEPLMWQVYNSAPFPDAKSNERDPRIKAAVDYLQWMTANSADSLKGHQLVVEEAEEEGMLLEQTMSTFYTVSFVPAYSWCRYIERLDKTEMFDHLRRCLQYLQWQFHHGNARPWLLKYPPNLGYESYVSRTFPGVKYIITHRDPYPVMASLAQMVTAGQLLYCRERDIRRFSRWALDEFSSEMERHLAWRDAHPDAPVIDVSFKDIVRNGMEVAHRVYRFLDAPWTNDTEARIHDWLVENEKQRDALEYSYDEIDFTETECRERFADYYQRFAALL